MIEWSTHHKDDPPLPEDDENRDKRSDNIDPWDQEFLKVDQGTLFELILVSITLVLGNLPGWDCIRVKCSMHINKLWLLWRNVFGCSLNTMLV